MSEERGREPSMDGNSLYQEETITDRKVGMLRRMTPIKNDGARDLGRPVLYVGQAEIMTNMGPMPISFEIEAASLDAAVRRLRRGWPPRRSSEPCNKFKRCAVSRRPNWSYRRAAWVACPDWAVRVDRVRVAARFRCPEERDS